MSFTKTPAAGSYLQININGSLTNIPGLEGLPEFGPEKQEYENTAIDDAAKTFGVDLPDPGEMTLVGSVDLRNAAHNYMATQGAGTAATTEGFKAVYKSGATATFGAKILSFRIGAVRGQDEKFSCRVKLSGAVTYTPGT